MTPGPSPTRRRVLAAAGTLLLPIAARAQTAKRRRIAYLASGSPAAAEPFLEVFRQALRALGYRDDGDIEIEIRGADGQVERLPDLARELVHLGPEVIVTATPQAAYAAKQATSTIPIVISIGDPVGLGFVSSLAHPGGNITGLSTVSPEMAGKWLQLLKTVIPGTERIAFLVNLRNPQQVPLLQIAQQAARTLRTDLLSVEASTSDEIDDAFATMAREHAQALIVTGDPVFFLERPRIVGYTASHKLPAIFQWREFAAIGGLMSYGPDQIDLFRRAATYVDKILKGAKPADLPVEQPTKFQLVVNLKTAQALGLTIPTVILAGADEVIE